MKLILSEEAQRAILEIIKRGNDAIVKKENNHIVVVESQRKVISKTAATG